MRLKNGETQMKRILTHFVKIDILKKRLSMKGAGIWENLLLKKLRQVLNLT